MANKLYPSAKEAFLSDEVDLENDTIMVALVDNSYAYSDSHDVFSDVSDYVVGTPVELASKTVTDGVFDAADSTFEAVTGESVDALVIYADSGEASTSPLIAFIDSAANLPISPSGGDITVQWHSSGIFTL